MSSELEDRLTEWALWFHENKKRIPPENLRKQNEFLSKAVDGCLELIAIAAKDIQTLERRDPLRKLWLPKGVTVEGDMKKFG